MASFGNRMLPTGVDWDGLAEVVSGLKIAQIVPKGRAQQLVVLEFNGNKDSVVSDKNSVAQLKDVKKLSRTLGFPMNALA